MGRLGELCRAGEESERCWSEALRRGGWWGELRLEEEQVARGRALRPSELVKWDPQRQEIVARYVQRLMEILWVDPGGAVKTSRLFELDAYLRILSQSVDIRGIDDPNRKRLLIQGAAFHRLKKYKIQGVHTFRHALAAQARQYLARHPRNYWILFPLHASPTEFERFRWFTVLETSLLVRRWRRVRTDFDLDAFLEDTLPPLAGLTISLEADFTPVVAMVRGRDSHEAFRQAARAFDLFRSLLNLVPKFGRMTKRFGFQAEPLGTILPPPVYGVFDSEGAYLEYWYSTTRHANYRSNTVPPDQIRAARVLAKKLAGPIPRGGTASLVVGALEKYGEALDATEWRQCFLVFWQILELLTLQTKGLNIKQVTNRICALLGQDQLVADLLGVLYDTRNELVHLGRFPADDEEGLIEINLLKHVVDRSLLAMIAKLGQLRSEGSLEKFYAHATESSAALADRTRVIAHITRNRAKRDSA